MLVTYLSLASQRPKPTYMYQTLRIYEFLTWWFGVYRDHKIMQKFFSSVGQVAQSV